MTDAELLMAVLWKWGYGEIRSYSTGARSVWCTAQDRETIARAIDRAIFWSDRNENVAIGVNPRSRMRHPCGKGKDISHYVACVMDFDSEETSMEGLRRLKAKDLDPSVLVHSGRGRHVYLLLDPPPRVEEFRSTARQICIEVGSDGVGDPPRILRMPGTRNPRTKTVASMLMFEPFLRYDPRDLAVRYPSPVPQRAPARINGAAGRGLPCDSPTLDDLLAGNISAYPSRSEAFIAAASLLYKNGYSQDDALKTLRESRLGSIALERMQGKLSSYDDLAQCIDKVWRFPTSTIVSDLEVERIVIRDGGKVSARIRVHNGPYAGQSWWQRVDFAMDTLCASIGSAQGSPRPAYARAVVALKRIQGKTAPAVVQWIPKQ